VSRRFSPPPTDCTLTGVEAYVESTRPPALKHMREAMKTGYRSELVHLPVYTICCAALTNLCVVTLRCISLQFFPNLSVIWSRRAIPSWPKPNLRAKLPG
jgi:hypothetical protein